jgi:hypothetical protein
MKRKAINGSASRAEQHIFTFAAEEALDDSKSMTILFDGTVSSHLLYSKVFEVTVTSRHFESS